MSPFHITLCFEGVVLLVEVLSEHLVKASLTVKLQCQLVMFGSTYLKEVTVLVGGDSFAGVCMSCIQGTI